MWVSLLLFIFCVTAAGRLYQILGERRDRRLCPPPGRIVDGLHLHAAGWGEPCVLFEAGVAATSLSWTHIQENVSLYARTLSYDRAGLGWSEPAPPPRSCSRLVAELDGALRSASIDGPFVLVGHSFGGFLVRHFAAAYPNQVAALVLVDPLDPDEYWPLSPELRHRLSLGVMMSRWGATLAWWGLVRLALDLMMAGSRLLPMLIARGVSTGQGAAFIERLVGEVRKMPPQVWPAVKAHWCLRKNFLAMADYLHVLPDNCATSVDDSAVRALPLWVLSAGDLPPERLAGHAAIARLSTRGVHVVVDGAGHWLHLDRPELVLRVIREAWDAARPGFTI